MTRKQKQVALICAILAVVYYTPSVVMSIRQAAFSRQQAAQNVPKAQERPSAPAPAANALSAASADLIGTWEGRATLPPSRGLCTFRIEIHAAQEPVPFAGFSTLACGPSLGQLLDPKTKPNVMDNMMLQNGLDPVSSILAGVSKGNAIEFQVNKVLGAATAVKNCAPTSFTLTPFGSGTLAAEFQDNCGGGQLLIKKLRQ